MSTIICMPVMSLVICTYIYTYFNLHILTEDCDDSELETTPLIKSTKDPDISTTSDDLKMTTTNSGSNKNHKKSFKNKAKSFFKALCIPGVVIVRYGHVINLLASTLHVL